MIKNKSWIKLPFLFLWDGESIWDCSLLELSRAFLVVFEVVAVARRDVVGLQLADEDDELWFVLVLGATVNEMGDFRFWAFRFADLLVLAVLLSMLEVDEDEVEEEDSSNSADAAVPRTVPAPPLPPRPLLLVADDSRSATSLLVRLLRPPVVVVAVVVDVVATVSRSWCLLDVDASSTDSMTPSNELRLFVVERLFIESASSALDLADRRLLLVVAVGDDEFDDDEFVLAFNLIIRLLLSFFSVLFLLQFC